MRPECGLDRALREHGAIFGPVRQFDAFHRTGKDHAVIAGDGTAAQRRKADIAGSPRPGMAIAATRGMGMQVDAPSGTAFLLGEAAAAGRGVDLHTHSARGRDGHTGARRSGDIGFASLRGGTVTGDHSVIFAGPMERIELTHRAEDRTMFAQGAVKAALWAHGKKPGFYTMTDVLGLTDF